LFGENITLKKVLAILLIVLGNLLAVYKNSAIKFNRGFALALIATVCFGLALTIDKRASVAYSLPVYSFITFFVPALYNVSLPPLPFNIIICEFKRAPWKMLLLAALSVLSYYFTLKAFGGADASKVIPIVNSSTIFVVLAGAIFLNERSHLNKKVIAGICVIIGILLLNS
jgi:drug/metabolite transporter (DMT)-like permease